MSNLKSILKSFHLRDNLNPRIWDEKDGEIIIKPKVRDGLLEISNEFIEFLKVDIIVSDIIMTGSLANYNWSNFSDIDLHIIVDFNQFNKNQLPLYEELFKLKKTLFNDKHEITIYGYEVELYVQNESESHFSSGVYSILNNEWITKPKKESVEVDTELIKSKSKQWMNIIDGVIDAAKDEPLEDARKLINKYKEKLKKYRTCGLEKNGEYSDENLVFKVLRRNNYIQKLFDFDTKHTDKELSLKENINIENEDLLNQPFIKNLLKIAESGKTFKKMSKPIPYDPDVEKIQTSLQLLGHSLPKWGVDGKFGRETESAVKSFEKTSGIDDDGILNADDIKKIISKLSEINFKETDLNKVKKSKDFVRSGNVNNRNIIMKFLINKGLTEEQSAGIVGNLQAESNFNPSVEGDNKTSIGIAQWHLTRKDKLINYCKSNNEDYKSLDCQLDFLWYELNTAYKKVLDKIRNSTTPEESAVIFASEYERPLSKDYSKRVRFAIDNLESYSNFT